MLLTVGSLLIGFAFLIKGADFLVDGASSIAKRLGLTDLVIGLTVVSFGTSAPELAVNISSALAGTADLAIGNVIGSNIANVLLILGVAATIYPLRVTQGTVWREIPLSLLATLALLFLVNDLIIDGASVSVLSRIDGLVLWLFFTIFLYYTYGISRVSGSNSSDDNITAYTLPISFLMIGGGLVGLVVGGQFIVTSASTIAATLGLSQALIGLTVVAIGTSLPELATSAVAAYKRRSDIAVGNVVGSNIFNIFFILATTSLIAPLPFRETLNFDLLVMLVAALLLFLAMFVGTKHKLERWQGVAFLISFVAYIGIAAWRG